MIRIFNHYLHRRTLIQVLFDLGLIVAAVLAVALSQGTGEHMLSFAASYGLSLCAEVGVAMQLHATGGGRLVAIAVVDADGAPLVPCGRCRQILSELGGPDLLVDGRPLRELLPDAFGPGHLG